MFKFPDWCYRHLPSSYKFWIALWIIWFITLWFLSSGKPQVESGPKLPHIDKVLHVGYFMIGGFCCANFLYLKKSIQWSWKRIILVSFLVGSTVGAIDEFHQSINPTRSGNDFYDWFADAIGTLAGAYYCFFMWKRLEKETSQET